jgi:hypothetical protein
MRKRVFRAFDDYIDTNGMYTSTRFNERLGEYDVLGLQVVVDDASSGSLVNFDLFIDHSSDGSNWLPARTPANQTPPFHSGAGDIRLSVSTTNPETGWYVTACSGASFSGPLVASAAGPLLHYVRLYMVIASGRAHVRVHAFQRD